MTLPIKLELQIPTNSNILKTYKTIGDLILHLNLIPSNIVSIPQLPLKY